MPVKFPGCMISLAKCYYLFLVTSVFYDLVQHSALHHRVSSPKSPSRTTCLSTFLWFLLLLDVIFITKPIFVQQLWRGSLVNGHLKNSWRFSCWFPKPSISKASRRLQNVESDYKVLKLASITSRRVAFLSASSFFSSSFFFSSSSSSLDLPEELDKLEMVEVAKKPFLLSDMEGTCPFGGSMFFLTVRGERHLDIIESFTLARSDLVGTPSLLPTLVFLKVSVLDSHHCHVFSCHTQYSRGITINKRQCW